MGEQQKMTLAEEVVKLLEEDELTVTTAESCTGGLVAARLVDVPGVSEVFKQGFITYSNKAKRQLVRWPRAPFWQAARMLPSPPPALRDRTAERKASR